MQQDALKQVEEGNRRMKLGTHIMGQDAYLNLRREKASDLFVFRKGMVRNGSLVYRPFVMIVAERSKMEFIQLKHIEASKEKYENLIGAFKEH